MVIRQLLPGDALAFQALRLRGLLEFPSAFSTSYAEEVETPLSAITEQLSLDQGGAVFGAFHDNELAGVVGIQRDRRKLHAHKALLWGMYVTAGHRSKGVGRSLVLQALQYAGRNLRSRSVNLRVNTANNSAIALYEAMGFTIYGTESGSLMVDGGLHDEHLMAWVNSGAA